MAEPVRGVHKSDSDREVEPAMQQPVPFLRAFKWALPLGTIAAAVAAGLWFDFGMSILVLAGGVLAVVIAILWLSVRTLSGDAPITLEEALALGAPSAAEEQKRSVLQALKDLDYERSVGKVSDADYEVLLARYRAEAKRLLRAVDEDLAPMRARAEAYLNERLAHPPPPAARATDATRACRSCQAANDVDAVFCKKCGAKLEGPKERRDATA